MRITIGGILLIAGVATVAVLGPLGNSGEMLQQAVDGVMSLVKSVTGSSESPAPTPAPSEEPAPLETTPNAITSVEVSSPPVTVSIPTAAADPAVETKPVNEPVIKKAPPVKSAPRKRRRPRRVKAKAAKPAKSAAVSTVAPAAPAVKSGGESDPLVGRYVSVKLKSGRDVKGVLLTRTAQNITLEIPGMGPFQYPASNIDGISAAE